MRDAGGGGGPTPDEAGFRQWMLLRAPVLRRKAYLLTGDWYAADDLVQDALVALYPKWARLARGGDVDAYANRVLFGKHVDARRRPWRRERSAEQVPDGPDRTVDDAFAAVDDRDSALTRALAGLPAAQRAVVVLRFTDDLSVEEIARVLDVPAGTVKSRLSRAVAALRAELDDDGHADGSASGAAPDHPMATEEAR